MKFIEKVRIAKWVLILIIFCNCISCQSLRFAIRDKDIKKELNKSSIFSQQFTGFSLYNPTTQEFLCHHNDQLLFTPASNTKILTTLACIENLRDSIPSYAFAESADTIEILPLADPTFLHHSFPNQPALAHLASKNILIRQPQSALQKYGSGWAWDDYSASFMPERSWFPIYGNSVRIYRDSADIRFEPKFFQDFISIDFTMANRKIAQRLEKLNIFYLSAPNDSIQFEHRIPFIVDHEVLSTLLEDTLGSKTSFTANSHDLLDTLYSQSTNNVLQYMMLTSDNFMAEQLLLQCALMCGYSTIEAYIQAKTREWETILPNKVRWVDGSGLSRYNLISPQDLVMVLEQIYQKKGMDWIETIFPIGGVSGTLKYWYPGNPDPYIFAKTGTFSNNHCLSGFIKTNSGKILIFSLMNNHYLTSPAKVKEEMQQFLEKIRDAY
jgi:serine-type D-Ala-D-Ala carboxypeptidase/endopeptidase (penicillin-binding protein 4)